VAAMNYRLRVKSKRNFIVNYLGLSVLHRRPHPSQTSGG
jgi:hypothetical protein